MKGAMPIEHLCFKHNIFNSKIQIILATTNQISFTRTTTIVQKENKVY